MYFSKLLGISQYGLPQPVDNAEAGLRSQWLGLLTREAALDKLDKGRFLKLSAPLPDVMRDGQREEHAHVLFEILYVGEDARFHGGVVDSKIGDEQMHEALLDLGDRMLFQVEVFFEHSCEFGFLGDLQPEIPVARGCGHQIGNLALLAVGAVGGTGEQEPHDEGECFESVFAMLCEPLQNFVHAYDCSMKRERLGSGPVYCFSRR
jgi:hypothetical protein